MFNRALMILGVPLFLLGMPFAIFQAIQPILDAYLYHPEEIELTSIFAIVPFLSWFWFLGVLGFICIIFSIKPQWSKSWNKALGTYIPCALFVVGVLGGTIGKDLIEKHLVDKDYVLISSEELRTSFYIPYDKDTYHRNQK